MKVVIVGGVASGATAAARLRRLDEYGEIVILEKSGHISYANCGLPYYLGGVIKDKNKLSLHSPLSLYARYRIDVRVNSEVIEINKERKYVKVKELITGNEYIEYYDKLLLATGSSAIIPNIEGVNENGIFTLKNVEDTYKIEEYIETHKVKNAAIIGGGFIGLELAENLSKKNINVSIIDKAHQLLTNIDADLIPFVHIELLKHDVSIELNKEIVKFEKKLNHILIHFNDGTIKKVDMVILSIGVKPNSQLAIDAGLEVGEKGNIIVDEYLRTSDPNILASGDLIHTKSVIDGKVRYVSLAGPANKQGRIAADNILGRGIEYKGTLGASIIKLFDLNIGSVGINEVEAKNCNYNYEKIIITPLNHASYYPGASSLTIKVIYNKDNLHILGAEIVGKESVDKKIDIISMAIYNNTKITDLQDIDFAYAPPFNSAKDAINIVGYVSSNIEDGLVKQCYLSDLKKIKNFDDVILLDIRTVFEFENSHLDKFINIPLDDLRTNLSELDKNKKIYVLCQSGLRSYLACRILSQRGYDCYNIIGGYNFLNIQHMNKKLFGGNYRNHLK